MKPNYLDLTVAHMCVLVIHIHHLIFVYALYPVNKIMIKVLVSFLFDLFDL